MSTQAEYYLDQSTGELAQAHLVDYLLARNPELEKEKIAEAIRFSIYAHRNQFRKSGMPYAEHPIEVSKILAELKLDTHTVIAGLLHDVVEDTEHSLEDIQSRFGAEVAFMVDAVTKISALQQQSRLERRVATYRKLLVSMSKDPRVIMIKMADRMHNMRTLGYMKPEKRKTIAQETLDLYAPLTNRFGLYRFKFELEDLAFKHLHPDRYKEIVLKLQATRKQRENYINSVVKPLEMRLNLEALPVKISGRPKHIHSIWQKMRTRGCQFDEVFDIFAVRLIVEEINECYLALGYVHNLWPPLQSRFKDYIAAPKPNLYQSLHTTVVGPEGKAVEIQIRTREMDEIAERGFAAHWAYKQETLSSSQTMWMKHLVQAQQDITDSNEFLDFLRVDLAPRDMVVFTPKGDAITLPHGATVLDFAFAVHTKLGYQCIGARIDNQFVAMDRPLSYGSTVHVLRSETQQPSLDWLDFVNTHRARSAIRRWNRTLLQEQAIHLGKEIFNREVRLMRIQQSSLPSMESICAHYGVPSPDDFFALIGRAELPLSVLAGFLKQYMPDGAKREARRFFRFRDDTKDDAVLVSKHDNILVQFADCCNPVPGDKIAGVLIRGKGIEVHQDDCPSFRKKDADARIPVRWKDDIAQTYDIRLEIVAESRLEMLEQISRELTRQNALVNRATVATQKHIVRYKMQIKVYNLSQVDTIIRGIRQLQGVRRVKRT